MAKFTSREILPSLTIAFGTIVSVFAFGGVEASGFALTQLTTLIVGGWIFWRESLPSLTRGTWIVLATLVAVPCLQLIPLPSRVVESLSLFRGAIQDSLRIAGVTVGNRIAISIYPHETIMALQRMICYGLVFLIAVRTHQTLRTQPILASIMIGLGLAEACYGIAQYLTGFQYIFFYKKIAPEWAATGTYINRNHYAGLLEMCLPFAIATMLNHFDMSGRRWRRFIMAQESRFLLDSVLIIVILTGLTFSLSRAGVTSGLAGIAITSLLMHQRSRKSIVWFPLSIFLIGGLYAFWIGAGPVFARFNYAWNSSSPPELRLAIWSDTVRLIQDSPLLGTGLGTYTWAAVHYQSSMSSLRYDHAHNDLLETAADLGIPAALLLWGGLATLLIRLLRRTPQIKGAADRTMAAACAGSITALLLHSLTDFNLQIPANAFIFSWIVGSGLAVAQRVHATVHRTSAEEVVLQVS